MQVSKLADLVNYQDGSVVSKEIIKKETATVTLFAFDKGQGLSEHTAPFDALVNVIDGQAEVTISGKQFIVNQGEMIIMPANKPHLVQAKERFKIDVHPLNCTSCCDTISVTERGAYEAKAVQGRADSGYAAGSGNTAGKGFRY